MYFIPRNNKVYNYIAHTNRMRRYLVTLLAVCALLFIGIYVVYYSLRTHNVLLHAEYMMLQKKYDDIAALHKSEQELYSLVEVGKKTIADLAISSDKHAEQCHERMLFVLDTIAQSGLTLQGYASCTEKDKVWYTKDAARFDVAGSFAVLMQFLEKIKNSRHMITISQVHISRTDNDTYRMNCDIEFVTIKR